MRFPGGEAFHVLILLLPPERTGGVPGRRGGCWGLRWSGHRSNCNSDPHSIGIRPIEVGNMMCSPGLTNPRCMVGRPLGKR